MIFGEYILKHAIGEIGSKERIEAGDGVYFFVGDTPSTCGVDFSEYRGNDVFDVRIQITDIPKRVLFALRNIEEWSVPLSEDEIKMIEQEEDDE